MSMDWVNFSLDGFVHFVIRLVFKVEQDVMMEILEFLLMLGWICFVVYMFFYIAAITKSSQDAYVYTIGIGAVAAILMRLIID